MLVAESGRRLGTLFVALDGLNNDGRCVGPLDAGFEGDDLGLRFLILVAYQALVQNAGGCTVQTDLDRHGVGEWGDFTVKERFDISCL